MLPIQSPLPDTAGHEPAGGALIRDSPRARVKTYQEKLKDPRWQKKRLLILQRDNWMCQSCSATDITLHVHHKAYKRGQEPWDYPDEWLLTLCEGCHLQETELREAYESDLIHMLRIAGANLSDIAWLCRVVLDNNRYDEFLLQRLYWIVIRYPDIWETAQAELVKRLNVESEHEKHPDDGGPCPIES